VISASDGAFSSSTRPSQVPLFEHLACTVVPSTVMKRPAVVRSQTLSPEQMASPALPAVSTVSRSDSPWLGDLASTAAPVTDKRLPVWARKKTARRCRRRRPLSR